VPWKTWREQRQAEQASERWSRSDVWEGCSVLLLIPMSIIGGIVGVVALTLGVDVLAGWMVSLIEPLVGPPLYAVIAAVLMLFAAWALFRLATGHAPPGTSRRDMIVGVIFLIGLAVVGLWILLAALASPAPDAPGF
jgi:hypothetical protein